MKKTPSAMGPEARPRRSLEQKIMLMVHRYLAAEKRRKQKEAVRSKRLWMTRVRAHGPRAPLHGDQLVHIFLNEAPPRRVGIYDC
jgi:hypothetical protein